MFKKNYYGVLAHISLLVHGQRPDVVRPFSRHESRYPSSNWRQSRNVRRFVEGIAPAIHEIPTRIHRSDPGLIPKRARVSSSVFRLAAGVSSIVVRLALVGILALSLIQISRYFRESPVLRSQVELREIRSALEVFHTVYGQFPSNQQGLRASQRFIEQPKSGPRFGIFDPWGRPYSYVSWDGGLKCRVWTYGADGRPGGVGENRDLFLELARPFLAKQGP